MQMQLFVGRLAVWSRVSHKADDGHGDDDENRRVSGLLEWPDEHYPLQRNAIEYDTKQYSSLHFFPLSFHGLIYRSSRCILVVSISIVITSI
jgi:hypothetical protein